MLSRLLTTKEQLLLLGVAAAVCVGAGALYVHDRTAPPQTSEVQVVTAPREEVVVPIPLEPRAVLPAPEPVALEPPALIPDLPPSPIAVYARGAVVAPGLYKLEREARVQDLIDKAQGVTADADLGDINMASKLMDGTALTIPRRGAARLENGKLTAKSGESAAALNPAQYTISGWRAATANAPVQATPNAQGPAETAPPSSAAAKETGLIDLNTATAEMLDSLPGIGPAFAKAIIKRRPFTSVDELASVKGLGPKKLEALRELVTVGSAGGPVNPISSSPDPPKRAAPRKTKSR